MNYSSTYVTFISGTIFDSKEVEDHKSSSKREGIFKEGGIMFETNKECLVLAKRYAMEAVTHARETFDTQLDFSSESLFELEHILGKFIEKSMGESGDAIKSGQLLSLGFNPQETPEPFGRGINVIRKSFPGPLRALKNIGILWWVFTALYKLNYSSTYIIYICGTIT